MPHDTTTAKAVVAETSVLRRQQQTLSEIFVQTAAHNDELEHYIRCTAELLGTDRTGESPNLTDPEKAPDPDCTSVATAIDCLHDEGQRTMRLLAVLRDLVK